MLSSLSVMSISSEVIRMLVCLLMRSFAVVIILFVMTFSSVMVCLWMEVCVISGIVISFSIVMHVPFIFCCRFVASSICGIGFLLCCCCSLSILSCSCFFSFCRFVIVTVLFRSLSCNMSTNDLRVVISFAMFSIFVFSLIFCVFCSVSSLFVVISAYVCFICVISVLSSS